MKQLNIKVMKTQEILKNIRENGGFNNFRNWNLEEKKEWVKSNFPCSNYVAKNVAYSL